LVLTELPAEPGGRQPAKSVMVVGSVYAKKVAHKGDRV